MSPIFEVPVKDDVFNLRSLGIQCSTLYRNPAPAMVYEHGVPEGDLICSAGALVAYSGAKTGRSPKDKRIVEHPASKGDIWWGNVNIRLSEAAHAANRQRAVDYLNTRKHLYVIDGFAGWDPRRQLKIRVICSRPYHALFMHNMLIRPTREQLANFGQPDYIIYNAGEFPADPGNPGVTSATSASLSFEKGEFIILGTQYAGEMKKGVFTIMNYLMPKQGVLSMHCAANEGNQGDVSLFFGLSGTGKTTLSADPHRQLIGDDEHCWSEDGVFNIEGGCYAKCVKLSALREPEIFSAVRFGAVLENTVMNPATRDVDYDDISITENTRCSYPIEYMPRAKIPCVGGHPKNIIFLTCDAFGVLPPVSKLSSPQAMYHFISGYTAKVAGTEEGVKEPEATFSACFGAAFMVWHPGKYAQMLADATHQHSARVWLINTGWTGGGYGQGKRISLAHTRAIIDAIHSGWLDKALFSEDPIFGLATPQRVPGVPDGLLRPELAWGDTAAYHRAAIKLAALFQKNFAQYADGVSDEVRAAAPQIADALAAAV
jgi:phosphoenolpyruvate carboxykinase (ATP)